MAQEVVLILSIGQNSTFEVRRQQRFEVGGLNRVERCCTNKDLFNCVPSLSEMEHKQLHQARLSIAPENLLQSIYAPGPLVLDARRWKTSMLLGE